MGTAKAARLGPSKVHRLSKKADKRAGAYDKSKRLGSKAKTTKREKQWRASCKRWRKMAKKRDK